MSITPVEMNVIVKFNGKCTLIRKFRANTHAQLGGASLNHSLNLRRHSARGMSDATLTLDVCNPSAGRTPEKGGKSV